ncbi:MAG: SDR family oxidoreductase [Terracidiphilus sp.]|jgi:3-oxoacyl-[acyl-carrier protein] reductase
MPVSLSLDGKTALITGGSRGIGAETVRLFVEAGARVAFNYRAAREQAEALVNECGGPDRCVAIEQELNTPEDGRALVRKAVAALGRLDILVANHGVWEPDDAPIEQMSEAQWRRTLGVNLDAVFGLVQGAVGEMLGQAEVADKAGPAMRGSPKTHPAGAKAHEPSAQSIGTAEAVPFQNSGLNPVSAKPGGIGCSSSLDKRAVKGHIVLISSTAGQRGEAYHADYAVTKGALISLTKSLSTELAPKGIMVNCVAPGWVRTDMSAATLADPVLGPKIGAGIPVGRVATPREIAGPVLFLCTPLAGFISGEILNVNGGAVLVG